MALGPTAEKRKTQETILDLDRRVEQMHADFQKFHAGEEKTMPFWEALEREIMEVSKRKMIDTALSHQLDSVMFKFQNRKKIWLRWIDDVHRS
jgi:hypothetical protein